MLPGFYHDVQDGNEFPHARDPGYLREGLNNWCYFVSFVSLD